MLYTIPVIGALIGWITNYLAVKMLFKPRRRIRFIGLTFQGVFPKRQAEIAAKVADIVASELLSSRDIHDLVSKKVNSREVSDLIDLHINRAVNDKVDWVLPGFLQNLTLKLKEQLKKAYRKEIDGVIANLSDRIGTDYDDLFDLRSVIRQRVEAFSTEKIETIANAVLQKEFQFIEMIGAVLGFLVGLLQLLVLHFFSGMKLF